MISIFFCLFSLVTGHNNNEGSIYANQHWVSLSSSDSAPLYPSPSSKNWELPTTEIFISISNFLDSDRCASTLNSLISHAKYPNRLKFGIVQQVETEETSITDNCIKKYCALINQRYPCNAVSQMKSVLFSKRLARGPAFAHVFDESLIENEDFCLQTDSHVQVIQNWDTELLTMWGGIGNEYAVISTELPSLDVLGKKINDRWEVPHLCHYAWDENGLPKSELPAIAINLDEPLLASGWSDSFSFSKCHAQKKTPNDPYLPRLDSGVTNVLKYARLWTRGYDVYSPPRSIIAQDMKPVSSDWKQYGMSNVVKTREFLSSVTRVKMILGLPGGSRELKDLLAIQRFGLGTKRTLDQLIKFTGIDFRNAELVDDRCKRLQWVPFIPDADPECEVNDLWGFAPEPQTAYLPIIPSYAPKTTLDSASPQLRKSLPWPFNFMDNTVEMALKELSVHSSRDEALEMLKIILLIIPIGAGLLALAAWSIISAGDEMRPPSKDSFLFRNDIKNV